MALPMQVQKDADEIAAYEEAMLSEHSKVVADPIEPVEIVPEQVVEVVSNVVDIKPTAEEETWEQRYKTLQGVNQVDARLHKELKQRFGDLQAELRKAKTVVAPLSLVTDEETVEFGADLLDVQRRIAKEELAPLTAQIERLEQENEKLREKVGQTEAVVASSSFEQKLLAAVPDFDAVNANPLWVAWLDEIDPILRGPRREVAQAAYGRGDVEALASYVNLFKGSSKPSSAARTEASAELQSQVAPPKSVSGAKDIGSAQLRTYTEAEAGQLFDKVGLLYRKGKTEEASKLDAEITLAYHQGRVR